MKSLFAAMAGLLLPICALASSPGQELADRFVDVLRRDDFGALAKLVDPAEANPRTRQDLTTVLERHDCIRVDRYEWSPEPAPADRLAIRIELEGTGALKAAWRPPQRLEHIWHLEARQAEGSWRVTRAFTEERRVARAMAAAATPGEAERIAAEARGVDPLKVIANYAAELDTANNVERIGHALSLARGTGDVSTEIRVMRNYARARDDVDRPGLLVGARAAEQLARVRGSHDDLGEALLTLGYGQWFNGQYEEARKTYAEGAGMDAVLDDPTTAMKCLQMYMWIGESRNTALETLRQTERLLNLAERYGWEEGEDLARFNHAITHWELGNLDVVRADLTALVARSRANGNARFLANAVNNLADLEERLGNYDQAILYAEEAVKLYAGDRPFIVGMLWVIGKSQLALGHLDEAEATIQKAEAIADPALAGAIAVLQLRGMLHLRRGHPEEAVAAVREALRRLAVLPNGDFRTQAELLGDLARALVAAGRKDEGAAELRKAVDTVESRQEGFGADPLGRAAFMEDYIDLYRDLIALLVEHGQPAEAFRVAEQMRSRGLREAVTATHLDPSASMPAEERSREEMLQGRVVEINKALLEARQKNEPAAELEQRLTAARAELNGFEAELRIKRPAVGRRRVDAPSLLELPKGSEPLALIEYVLAGKQILAFVMTRQTPVRVVALSVAAAAVERDARELEKLMAARSPGYREVARRLYAALIRPLEQLAGRKATLAIVPDGFLWIVPFQALIADDGRHLIDRQPLFYAQSLSLLQRASMLASGPGVGAPSRLLALGNPTIGGETRSMASSAFRDSSLQSLVDAETEVREVAAMYPGGGSRVYYGDAASEAAFKQDAPTSGVIHIAAHALIEDSAPMYSAIVLAARGHTDDGLLEAREVADLQLHAGLAVLSACGTARGRIGGEGVIGLNWSFFAAGCPTTVVSQWSAESRATSRLMIAFHRRLRAGDTVAEALRAAQRSVRRMPQYSHPFYWAPFVAVGMANRPLGK